MQNRVFKVGDRVKCVDTEGARAYGVSDSQLRYEGVIIRVLLERDEVFLDNHYWYPLNTLQLVEPIQPDTDKYTVEEVFEAVDELMKDLVGYSNLPWERVASIKKALWKKKHPEYAEYLRLKELFEKE